MNLNIKESRILLMTMQYLSVCPTPSMNNGCADVISLIHLYTSCSVSPSLDGKLDYSMRQRKKFILLELLHIRYIFTVAWSILNNM